MPKQALFIANFSKLAAEMRSAIQHGHMDRFKTLARQRNQMLQWMSGMLQPSDQPRSSAHPPADTFALKRIYRQSIEENMMLIQTARQCMAATQKKIDALNRRRQSQFKLSTGYTNAGSRTSISTVL